MKKTEEIRLDSIKFVKLLYGFEILSDFEQLNEDEVNDSILTDLDAFLGSLYWWKHEETPPDTEMEVEPIPQELKVPRRRRTNARSHGRNSDGQIDTQSPL